MDDRSGFVKIDPVLTLDQLFRLVEIAHETKVPEARKAAVALLEDHFRPPLQGLPVKDG